MSRQREQVPQCALAGAFERQWQVGVELAEKEPRARVAIDQGTVLAIQPSPASRPAHVRAPVLNDECAIAERPGFRSDPISEALQATAHELVVVAAQCIARDIADTRIVEHLPAVAGAIGQIVHARRNHAQRAGHQFLRPAAFGPMSPHVVHFAVPPGIQPVHEVDFISAEVDAGDADLLETDLGSPAADIGNQL